MRGRTWWGLWWRCLLGTLVERDCSSSEQVGEGGVQQLKGSDALHVVAAHLEQRWQNETQPVRAPKLQCVCVRQANN